MRPLLIALLALPLVASAQNFVRIPNVTYGTYLDSNNQVVELKLDVYKPVQGNGPFPCVVWIHGGGWSKGSKEAIDPHVTDLTTRGYVVASINYRLVQAGPWPAQINDCRGAVRFLRANAALYGIDPTKFATWGNSAGGHLSLMMATAGDTREYREGNLVVDLEGTTGGNLDQSSAVQACINYFGVADLLSMNDFDARYDSGDPSSGASRMVGGPLQERPEMAIAASPSTYVSPNDPPTLHVHGAQDDQVPFNQTESLAYLQKQRGARYAIWPLPNGGHGGTGFRTPPTTSVVYAFLDEHLKGRQLQHPNFLPTATPAQGQVPLETTLRPIFTRAIFLPAQPIWSFGDSGARAGGTLQHRYEWTGEFPMSVTVRLGDNGVTTNTALVRVFAPGSGPQGTLRFHNTSRLAREVGTAIWVRVLRQLGSTGAVSVSFRTSPGSALPGLDYVHTEGRLDFADGETVKVIKVPVIDDGVTEPEENFFIEMGNPTGGAVVGVPGRVTVRLVDQ